jgi:hypothetical protein
MDIRKVHREVIKNKDDISLDIDKQTLNVHATMASFYYERIISGDAKADHFSFFYNCFVVLSLGSRLEDYRSCNIVVDCVIWALTMCKIDSQLSQPQKEQLRTYLSQVRYSNCIDKFPEFLRSTAPFLFP